jgi:SAM-dependent methyltransferase
MAHIQQQEFFKKLKDKFPERFENCSVVDIGSLDINGNNRYLFNNYTYIGVDVGPGLNVDVVAKGHEYKSETQFDFVISSECFEHDMYYPQTIQNCIDLTKTGGMFTFTCASTGRAEHGTRRSSPQDAPLLPDYEEWGDYYKNLTENDIREVIDIDQYFSEYEFFYNAAAYDLYFWGIKK